MNPRQPVSPLLLAFGIHASLLLLGVGVPSLLEWLRPTHRPVRLMQVEVREAPRATAQAIAPIAAPSKPVRAPIPARRVFGVSRAAMTSQDANSNTVAVKAGNTLAKPQDDETLRPEDETSLPLPTEDYLVTEMPRLQKEIRAPYPAAAKARNIAGVVTLDLLIDATGKVRRATLIDAPPEGVESGLAQAAIDAAMTFEFTPARVQQQTVAVTIRYAYRFILEK